MGGGPEVFQASAAADVFPSGAVGSSCRKPNPDIFFRRRPARCMGRRVVIDDRSLV